jgi:phage gp29-like protein
MGLWDKMPWNVYAQREKDLQELAREIMGEQGIFKDDTYARPDEEDFNPTDFDLEVYEKMLKDGQVKAGMDIIKLSATARGFTVSGDDPETKEYAEFIVDNFEQIRGNLEDVLGEMLTALEYGYSATEKVFEQREGKIMLKKLKVLNPHSIRVKTNRYGDIEYVNQRIGTKTIKIKAEKIMWYAHNKKFGNQYGESALRTTYKHWFIKDKMYRFANIAYERYGTPLLVGQVQDAKDTGKMRKLLEKINGMTGLAISGEDKVTAIQGSNADFVGYIEHHDRKIMESLLVPPMLLGIGRGQGGSYALSGNQFDLFMIRLESLQRDLKAIIEEEIIRPLIDLNFPNVKRYPAFTFKSPTQKDTEKLANVFEKMINAQVVAPQEDWLREELGMPPMSKEMRDELEKQRKETQEALKKANEGNTPDNEGKGSEEAPEGSQDGSKK